MHARRAGGGPRAAARHFTQATPVDQAREGLVIAPIRPGHQLWLHHSRRYDWAPVAAFIPLCVTSMPELFRGTADAPPEPVVSRRLRLRQQLNRRQFAVLRRYIVPGRSQPLPTSSASARRRRVSTSRACTGGRAV